jgi:DNA-directed RNA polymerase subunit L
MKNQFRPWRSKSQSHGVLHIEYVALSLNNQLKSREPQTLEPIRSSYTTFHPSDIIIEPTAHLSATVQPRDTLNSAFLKGIVRLESTAQASLC